MASKQELIDKIQTIAKRVYASKVKDNTLGVTPEDVNFDDETFPVLTKFPVLKKVITDLLTDQFEMFISDIQWVAPRPTTFKIVLANQQYFYLSAVFILLIVFGLLISPPNLARASLKSLSLTS